jgi:ectoine hydroxylase
MTTLTDKYPSRMEGVGQIIQRQDPVVYGSAPNAFSVLTASHLADYERDGFLFLDSFFTNGELKALQGELDALRTSEQVRQSEIAVTEPTSGETRSIFAVHTVSELLAKVAADERLLGIVRQILGSEVYIHQSRLNFKPGFRGKEFYWHSDFETWHAEDGMPSMRAISCSIALTDNYEFNGPLMLIPGSHKHFCQCSGITPENHYQQSLKKQDYGVPNDEQLTWLVEQGGIVVPKGPAGSVTLFECNTMHGSNGNITPFPRSNFFVVYNSVENVLTDPFAADDERPWFLGNREPEPIAPVDFRAELGGAPA